MTSNFTQEEIDEFATEAFDLLDEAEAGLLATEKGAPLAESYDAIFRAFHSIKGGAGMLGLDLLATQMHQMENLFTDCKKSEFPVKKVLPYFISGIDISRRLLRGERFILPEPPNVTESSEKHTEPSKAQATPAPQSTTAASPSLPDTKPTVAKTPAAKATTKPGIIYVVDDEPEILEIISDSLKHETLKVQTFTNPEDLLKVVATAPPDVILTDMKMPQMTGLELLSRVRRTHPDIVIVFVSGYLSSDVLISALQNGIFAAIEKPFSQNDILNTTLSALQYHRISRLLNRGISLLLYQFADLDAFLRQAGKADIAQSIKTELNSLIETKRLLNNFTKSTPA